MSPAESSEESAIPEKKRERAARKAAAREARKRRKAEKKAWKRARPKREPWASPILWVSDVRGHAAFCERAFGFEVESVIDGPDGQAVHAILRHRRASIMLGKAGEPYLAPPRQLEGSTATQYVYSHDVDELVTRATAAGATLVGPPTDEPWGDRCARLLDPEGHSWMFATHLRGARSR